MVRALLACILCSDVLAYLLSIWPCSFGVNVNLKKLSNHKNEMLEKWAHFDHNEILLPSLFLTSTLQLRNDVKFLELVDGGEFKLADFV